MDAAPEHAVPGDARAGRRLRDGRCRDRAKGRERRRLARAHADPRSPRPRGADRVDSSPTAGPSACPPTTTWATARSATTRSAPAGSSIRVPSSSPEAIADGSLFEGEKAKTWQASERARARARRDAPLPGPPLRRQRPQPHRPPLRAASALRPRVDRARPGPRPARRPRRRRDERPRLRRRPRRAARDDLAASPAAITGSRRAAAA